MDDVTILAMLSNKDDYIERLQSIEPDDQMKKRIANWIRYDSYPWYWFEWIANAGESRTHFLSNRVCESSETGQFINQWLHKNSKHKWHFDVLDLQKHVRSTDLVKGLEQWSGGFLGIIGWDPSVCKSNRLHIDILRFSFIKLGYIL